MLNKQIKVLFTMFFLVIALITVNAQESSPVRVYRVQFAASKTFIEPSYFERKFSLEDSIKYFEKDGWYKYYIGDFKTRVDAEDYYHETGDVGYVISILTAVPAYLSEGSEQIVSPGDTVGQEIPGIDSTAISRQDSIDSIYNRKIRMADSAFNAGDYELAKSLYRETAELKPDLAYSMLQVDKIINLEAAELESGKKGLSGLQIFFIGLIVFIIAVILSRVFGRKKKPAESNLEKEDEPVKPLEPVDQGYLTGDEPFKFLDDPQKDLSSWDQMKILEEIREKKIDIPDFSYWLGSENLSVVGFSLRMIRSFDQRSAYRAVLGLLGHQNDEIRAEVIVTLGELGVREALESLRTKFESENLTNRMLILRAMARIPDESNIDFLKELLKTSGNIQIEAAYALASIPSVGVKGVQEVLEDLGKDSERIARHILINKL